MSKVAARILAHVVSQVDMARTRLAAAGEEPDHVEIEDKLFVPLYAAYGCHLFRRIGLPIKVVENDPHDEDEEDE